VSNEQIGNELKWKKFNVGSGGNVCLVDWMGDDYALAEAARVCYGEGTKHTSSERGLIRYLMRHWHTSPFEMAELKFRVRAPMDTWRQWIRHRTANVNEYSTRYSVAIPECSRTLPGQWRLQAEDNKQGSSGFLNPVYGDRLTARETEAQTLLREVYEERLEWGVAREQARKELPLSNYTEAYWKIDLHNLFHFLRLRRTGDAQKEIREYATIIGDEIVSKMFPHAWEAFVDYRLDALILSRLDNGVIQRIMQKHVDFCGRLLLNRELFMECQDETWVGREKCQERNECFEKLQFLGIMPS
jgi:thymidylate synthase (FAD)